MKIYVSTYKKYNNGSLSGKWLDLNDYTSYEDFINACKLLHSDEKNPEFMYQDIEAQNWEKSFYSESSIDSKYWDVKSMIEDSGIDESVIMEYVTNHVNTDDLTENDIQQAIDSFFGFYDSEEDFAIEYYTNNYPKIEENPLFNYVDWDSVARDLSFDFDFIYTSDHKIAVFDVYR